MQQIIQMMEDLNLRKYLLLYGLDLWLLHWIQSYWVEICKLDYMSMYIYVNFNLIVL